MPGQAMDFSDFAVSPHYFALQSTYSISVYSIPAIH